VIKYYKDFGYHYLIIIVGFIVVLAVLCAYVRLYMYVF